MGSRETQLRRRKTREKVEEERLGRETPTPPFLHPQTASPFFFMAGGRGKSEKGY